MKNIRKIFLVVIAFVMVSALAACGSSNNETTKSSDADGGGNANGKASNSVTVGISQEIDSLDPHNAEYAGTREVLFNLYDGLVKAEPNGDLEPAVASEYTVSDDAMSITFTLRDGVKFSDGTEVTAEDVKYSIERYADIQGSESAFSDFREVVINADGTITVNLAKPNTEFIYELTCAVLPESNDAQINSNPIGTGPFKFESYTPGDSLVITKNEYYWKTGYPFLDSVTFKVVTNTNTAIMELNAGTLDIFQYLTADQAATVDSGNFNILEGNVNYVQALFLNNAKAPFDNVKVRQAMCYAVDRELINQMIFEGKSHVIGTNMIPGLSKYYNEDTESVYAHDVQKAKELLAEAGYPDGFSFTITVPNNYAPHESTAQIIVENLAEVGIKAEINLVEFTTWYSDVYVDRNYDATVVAVDGRLAPFSWFEKNVSTGVNNFTNYSNAEFDEVYSKALAEIDLDKKVTYYRQLQEILTEDAASVYVQDPSNLVAVNSALEGYVFYPVSAQDMSVVKYK